MCYIVFISHSLHWRYIKIALLKCYNVSFSPFLTLPLKAEFAQFSVSCFYCQQQQKINEQQSYKLLNAHDVFCSKAMSLYRKKLMPRYL